jgi:Nif-specific regulatory protein
LDGAGLEELLGAISSLLAGSLGGLPERLEAVTRSVVDALEVERCWIVAREGQSLRTLAGVGMVLAHPSQTPLPIDKGVVGWVAREGKTRLVYDSLKDPDYWAAVALTRSEVAAPIVRDGKVLGVLNVEANRVGAFGTPEQHVVEAIAALLAGYL